MVTLRFQPSLNSDPPGSALWFAPSRIVVYPIARAWLRGYNLTRARLGARIPTEEVKPIAYQTIP